MVKGLHNRLGERGQALTILSLLRPATGKVPQDTAGSLADISEQLRQIAGGDDSEVVDMYSVYPSKGGSLEFLSLELVPLRQAIEKLHVIQDEHNARTTVLSVIDPAVGFDDDNEPGGESESGGVGQALGHLKDALRNLFNRAGENGQQLTVLSLLSEARSEESPGD